MTAYQILFPRWEQDIVTKRRTLVHLPCRTTTEVCDPGDLLLLMETERAPTRTIAEVEKVTQIRLCESLGSGEEDLVRLGLVAEGEWLRSSHAVAAAILDYQQRWNVRNPEDPWVNNPLVWRIVFRYLSGSEALAAMKSLLPAPKVEALLAPLAYAIETTPKENP